MDKRTLGKTEKLILALSGESVRINLKGQDLKLGAILHLPADKPNMATFELECGARILQVEFKRIGTSKAFGDEVLLVLDLY